MGKKKAYKLPEYEHQHNRVDIFRTIQLPRNIEHSDPPPPFIFNIDMNNVASVPNTIFNASKPNPARNVSLEQSLNSTVDSLTAQQHNNTQNPISGFHYLNSYSNEAFVSSSNDLTLNNSSDFLPNTKRDLFAAGKTMPVVNRDMERDRDEEISQPEQFVWTTAGNSQHPGAKFIQNGAKLAAVANANARHLKKSRVVSESPTSLSEREEPSSRKRRHLIIWVLIALFLLLALTAVGLALAFTILKSKEYNQRCFSSCDKNQYCVKNPSYLTSGVSTVSTTTSSALSVPFLSSLAASLLPNHHSQPSNAPYCTCKPGYSFDSNNIFVDNSTCKQTVCYDGFYPYTYLSGYSPQTPLPADTQYIKPYCCPNSHYLTNGCCGVSMSNSTLALSKRIIGGSQSSSGLFPWMVYVTQVYRLSPTSQITMIKNCSGVLLSDRYVLTAGHCTDLDSMIELNDEFPSTESIMRVYFGFVDKSQIFKPNNLARHERLVRRIYKHPNYKQSTLQNDLAILELTQSINRDVNTDYICLFNYINDDSLVTQTKLYMAGWGSINPSHTNLVYPDVLHHVDAIVFPMSFCTYIYPEPAFSFIFNSTTHVCAGYPANYNKDSC